MLILATTPNFGGAVLTLYAIPTHLSHFNLISDIVINRSMALAVRKITQNLITFRFSTTCMWKSIMKGKSLQSRYP